MGYNMGLGMAAAAMDAENARILREQERQNFANNQERFGWERQLAMSDLGDMPYISAARRSGAGLQDARNRAATGNVDVHAEADRTGAQAKTARNKNDQFDAETVRQAGNSLRQTYLNQAKYGAQGSEAELDLQAQKIRRAAVQGQLDEQGQADVVLGTLAQFIQRQDKSGALAFSNKIAKITDILPGTNGMNFTDIAPVQRGQTVNGQSVAGDGYAFTTADGKTFVAPIETLRAAADRMKSGKYHFLHTNDGSVYSGNENTGAVTQVHKGDPRVASAHNPNATAEMKNMQELLASGVAKDPAHAWQLVRSAREKSRQEFVLDYVSKNAAFNSDPKKAAADAGSVYDFVHNQGATTGRAASNSFGPTTVNPLVNSLLSIPSQ